MRPRPRTPRRAGHRGHRGGALARAAPPARRARLRHRLRRGAVVRAAALVRRTVRRLPRRAREVRAPAPRPSGRRDRRLDRATRVRADADRRASSTSGARRRPPTSARTRASARFAWRSGSRRSARPGSVGSPRSTWRSPPTRAGPAPRPGSRCPSRRPSSTSSWSRSPILPRKLDALSARGVQAASAARGTRAAVAGRSPAGLHDRDEHARRDRRARARARGVSTPGRSGLVFREPLLFESSRPGRRGVRIDDPDVPPVDPARELGAGLVRDEIRGLPRALGARRRAPLHAPLAVELRHRLRLLPARLVHDEVQPDA